MANPFYQNYIKPKLTESEYVFQAMTDKIYTSDEFLLNNQEKAKYIWKVDSVLDDGINCNNQKRLKIQLTYNTDKNEVIGITLKKFNGKNESEKISVSNVNLAQIQEFLGYIEKIDLKAFSTNRIYLNGNNPNNHEIIKQIQTLLDLSGKTELLKTLLEDENITNQDLVNTGFRKRSLETFSKLLEEGEYLQDYKIKIGKPTTKDEIAWQYFFEQNEWIFGYGLDYKFQAILQKEYAASDTQADGSNQVRGDFLLGDNKFTTFVEIKKPTTNLFNDSRNRSNSWKLSTDLFDSYSQILEQKSSGQIKYESGNLHNTNGSNITQKPYDSKTILIIGNWSEISSCNDLEKQIKEKTFELFRRDSRNIEIITFDELYDRACFIVTNKI